MESVSLTSTLFTSPFTVFFCFAMSLQTILLCNLILPCSVTIFPSLRPPNLPPKPLKHRKPRPRSQYSAKLFNGDLESFIKVLAEAILEADLNASFYNGHPLTCGEADHYV